MESTSYHHTILDNMPEALFVCNFKGEILDTNQTACVLLDYSTEQFKKLNFRNIITPNSITAFNDKIEQLLTQKNYQLIELEHIEKDGKILPAELSLKIIHQNDENVILIISRDITELKNTEVALRESEEKYRLVVENANEGIFIIQDGLIVFSNQFVRNILGYNDEELKKEHFINLIHPDDKETVFDNYKKRMEGNFIPMYISRVKKKNGDYVSVEVRATKIEYKGKPATLNLTTDITDKLKSERELKENEARYRSFFSNSIEAISIFDTETMKFIEVNDAFCSMYGYSKEEALEMTVSDVSAEPEVSAQAIKTSVQKGGVNIPIRYHKKKDGTVMIVRISAGPFIWKGRKVMYSIIRDITEQLITEQELINSKDLLQTMADSMPAYVGVADADTFKYKFVNQKFVASFKKPREEIIGSYFEEIIGKENAKFALPYIESARKGIPSSYINTFDLAEGKRYINVSFTPSFSSGGKVNDIIIMSHDITDIKKAEEELKKAKEEAEKANQIKSELIATKNRFFSIIAHDLKSPFNGLIGLSGLLMNKSVDKNDYKLIASHLHDTAINGFTLLENLLDWARTQTGEIKFKPERINLKEIIDYNIGLLKQNAIEKNINLSKSITNDILIEADSQMINTILRNLISNAIKFTHKEGSVTIESFIENRMVNITVTDSGIGIKTEDIPKLFNIGESYSNLGTENEGGTGLGLILCKEFVDKHSGSINVESETSNGTKITVKLPIQINMN